MAEQYLSTSRLGNVMRLIALGRQTGLLRAVRGQGPSREEGEVQFVDGQVMMAVVGQLTGGAAMSVLQNWGESYYLFLDGVNKLQPNSSSGGIGWGQSPNSGSLPPMGSGSFPNTFGNSQPGMNGHPEYGPPSGYPSTSLPPQQQHPTSGPYGRPMPGTGPLPPLPPKLMDINYVPRRITVINPADMAALDRRERQLLLLIDSRRTIIDLVRLTRRADEEIQYILAHLIALGLVD